jgi:hypothetical protein
MKITDEQVERARCSLGRDNYRVAISCIKSALEAASQETPGETTDVPNPYNGGDTNVIPTPQALAVFGKLVVTREMADLVWSDFARNVVGTNSLQEALQSFVDRHAINPIAFAERMPASGAEILVLSNHWSRWGTWYPSQECRATHWLPALALPIPEPPVDPKELAWRGFKDDFPGISCDVVKANFEAVWEAAQREGK